VSRAPSITPSDLGRLGVTWAALMSTLLALVLGVAGAAAVLVALSSPDPFSAGDGSGRVRSLGELAPVMVGAPFLVGAAIALGILGRALWRGRWTAVGRAIARWAGAASVLVAVLVGGNWLIERGHVLRTADCGSFRFSASTWRSQDVPTRVQAADGVARCGVLTGSREDVVSLLGAPDGAQATAAVVYDLGARTPGGDRLVLRVAFAGGRVSRAAVRPV
jgi:hypothetical protein